MKPSDFGNLLGSFLVGVSLCSFTFHSWGLLNKKQSLNLINFTKNEDNIMKTLTASIVSPGRE